jgi:hypothetical protein
MDISTLGPQGAMGAVWPQGVMGSSNGIEQVLSVTEVSPGVFQERWEYDISNAIDFGSISVLPKPGDEHTTPFAKGFRFRDNS